MRIIAGTLKGRKLKVPRNRDVRPTSDKVKEAVFSMLIPYMYEGFLAADIFAGTGSLGLEAVSRGASRVFFSDASRDSLSLVRENVEICQASDKAVLLLGDFKANIRRIREKVDIFFLDPPYADGCIVPAIEAISAAENLAEGGVIVCEHAARDVLPRSVSGFAMVKDRRYGAIGISLYERAGEDA